MGASPAVRDRPDVVCAAPTSFARCCGSVREVGRTLSVGGVDSVPRLRPRRGQEQIGGQGDGQLVDLAHSWADCNGHGDADVTAASGAAASGRLVRRAGPPALPDGQPRLGSRRRVRGRRLHARRCSYGSPTRCNRWGDRRLTYAACPVETLTRMQSIFAATLVASTTKAVTASGRSRLAASPAWLRAASSQYGVLRPYGHRRGRRMAELWLMTRDIGS